MLADQRVTIRLVKSLFLYAENTILPISVPGLLEKHMSDSSIILEFIALRVKARGDGPFVL